MFSEISQISKNTFLTENPCATVSIVFKLQYSFVKGNRIVIFCLNELEEKTQTTTVLGSFVKQTKIILLLAWSFHKMFFIGQNLNNVHVTYSFDECLIFFWLILEYNCLFKVWLLATPKKYYMPYSKGNK